jgi:isoleucyl-tRNA synthetase
LQACLLGICQLTAPCIPLLSETIYQNLKLTNSPESLHLVLWPRIEENTEEENNLISAMSIAQEIINLGRSLRQELKLKIRQPLSQIIIAKEYAENKYLGYFESLILSELNIKQLVFAEQAEKVLFNTEITPELLAEGLARELIHTVQNLRKNSGLEVSDRIKLYINLQDNNLKAILESQSEYIKAEVLAQDLLFADNLPENKKALKLNGQSLEIGLEKIVKQ